MVESGAVGVFSSHFTKTLKGSYCTFPLPLSKFVSILKQERKTTCCVLINAGLWGVHSNRALSDHSDWSAMLLLCCAVLCCCCVVQCSVVVVLCSAMLLLCCAVLCFWVWTLLWCRCCVRTGYVVRCSAMSNCVVLWYKVLCCVMPCGCRLQIQDTNTS